MGQDRANNGLQAPTAHLQDRTVSG